MINEDERSRFALYAALVVLALLFIRSLHHIIIAVGAFGWAFALGYYLEGRRGR